MASGTPDYLVGGTHWLSTIQGATTVYGWKNITTATSVEVLEVSAGKFFYLFGLTGKFHGSHITLSLRNDSDTVVAEIINFTGTANAEQPQMIFFSIPVRIPAGYDFIFESDTATETSIFIYGIELDA